jgi:hypothetical protein
MAAKDAAPLQTAFTVTIEAATGVSTGISMARVPDLIPCCRQRGLKMVTVADLIAYRRRTEKAGRTVVATALPTTFGDFTAVGYRSLVDDKTTWRWSKARSRGPRTCWFACTASA